MRRRVYRNGEYETSEIRPGLGGAVLEGDAMTIVRWEFPPRTPRTGMHTHEEHEQYGVVLAGAIEMQIGDEVVRLGAGDIYWVPKKLTHGRTFVLGDEPAVVLDIFSPPRPEYVAAAHGGPVADPTRRSEQ